MKAAQLSRRALHFRIDDGFVIEIDAANDDTTNQRADTITTSTRHVRIEKAENEHVSS